MVYQPLIWKVKANGRIGKRKKKRKSCKQIDVDIYHLIFIGRGPLARKKAGRDRGRRGKKGQEDDDADMKPPSWFDLTPFLEAFKKFTSSNANVRTQIRFQLEKKEKTVRMMFCHENGEPNAERCQDILTLAERLNKDCGFDIEEENASVFGNILGNFYQSFFRMFRKLSI